MNGPKSDQRNLWFIALNTIVWIGLGAILITNPVRLAVGGTVLLLLIGGYLLYYAFRGNLEGLARPGMVRSLSLFVGASCLAISAALVGWILQTDFPAQDLRIQQQISEAHRHETTILDLSDMRLKEIPPEVFELTSLTHLSIDNNRLERLPAEIGRLSQLKTLDISYNRLISVPLEIENLTSLEHLHLRHNRLSELPPEVGELTSLETLNVAENELSTLPKEIQQLADLQQLILFQNDLTVLPMGIVRLQDLQVLAVEHNEITALPQGVEDLPNLHTLRLTGNPIDDLPLLLVLRAGQGELTLEHDPDKREPLSYGVGAVNAFFIGSLITITAGTYGIGAWIDRRNAGIANRLSTRGQVFRVPPFARAQCILVLLLVGLVTVPLFAESIRIWRADQRLYGGIFVPLILAPAWLFCIYMLVHNSGFVVLTFDAVIMRHLGREKRVPYEEITGIKEMSLALPPNMVIKSRGKTLSIPRSVEAFDDLYELVTRAVDPKQASETTGGTSPLDLRVPQWVILTNAAAVLALTLFYLGVGLVGFWLPLVQKTAQPLPSALAMLIFTTTSLVFIPLIIFYVLDVLALGEPFEIIFLERAIRFRFPFKEWQIRSKADLIAVDLKQNPESVETAVGPFNSWRMSKRYPLTIKFSGGQQLRISWDRARQFGVTPDNIYSLLHDLYRA